ncbi:hypothetical protein M5D96_007058 [Drosophila gunungcola]|uniref:Uncharacterized protein n=1 Tax=Drosophila gunungcola TaxID=103775 RepID=A0A9P9YN15_9MUSC|nr:hypothetical protein M5D96_007058 [Drosophila gunungcola]
MQIDITCKITKLAQRQTTCARTKGKKDSHSHTGALAHAHSHRRAALQIFPFELLSVTWMPLFPLFVDLCG